MKEDRERKLKLIQSWNKIARLFNELKEAWDAHKKLWEETPRQEIETYPPKYQKFLARNFNRSKFDIMLPRMVDYWRTIGGVGELQVKVDPKEIMKAIKQEKETK